MKSFRIQPAPIAQKYGTNGLAGRYGVLLFALVAMLLVLTPRGWGQDNATITGTVEDASGAMVPNVAITLTNPATGQIRETVSNNAGDYRFANVGVGTYTP